MRRPHGWPIGGVRCSVPPNVQRPTGLGVKRSEILQKVAKDSNEAVFRMTRASVPQAPEKPAGYLRRARELEAEFAARSEGARAVRLGVLASFSADLLRPFLVVEADRLGVPLHPWFGGFNQFEQVVFGSDSPLWTQRPDALWIAMRLADVDPAFVDEFPDLGVEVAAERLGVIRRRMVALARAAREHSSATILVSNLAPPPLATVGLFDAGDPNGITHLVTAENRALARDLCAMADVHVFDFAGVVADAGAGTWSDDRFWYMARAGASASNQTVLARCVARSLSALFRSPAKCLVLDLDNTLWGGVLGDDGLASIILGDDYPGSVFKDFQQALLGYRRRGFLLALASKNDPGQVREALDDHPEMVLRTDHFAAIEVGWGPKPASLRRIAEKLNIGLDALVFVDDNPVERATVKAELPMVGVVELPNEPIGYVAALRAFEALDRPRLLAEDRSRAGFYVDEAGRQEVREAAPSVEHFLADLGMVARVGACDAGTIERIHQLVHKTNQFNLTTRRHKLENLQRLAAAPGAAVLWLRLGDRFGDMGLVCVGIVTCAAGDLWEIDTLLMSCRVMGRRVEDAFLAYLAERAAACGARHLRGVYRKTARSTPVRDFYSERGFTLVSHDEEGSVWERDLAAAPLAWPAIIYRVDVGESVPG